MMETFQSSSEITVHVKTPKEKKTFQVSPTLLVKEVRYIREPLFFEKSEI